MSFLNDLGNPGKFIVQFGEDVPFTNDSLLLRVAGGQLQYALNGAGFTNDLDSSAPGLQALPFGAISRIDVIILAGNDSLRLDMTGGNVIPAISGIKYDGGTGTDTIDVAKNANYTLANTRLTVSPGGVVNLTDVEHANLIGGNSANTMDASAFSSGSVTMDGGGQNDTLIGGAGNDTLIGTEGSDVIDGRGGNDVLFSGNSGSTVSGGDGNDTLFGGNGKDFLYGQGGDDQIFSSNGVDLLDGGEGNDLLEGNHSGDAIVGSSGIDTVQATGDVNFTLTDSTLIGLGTDSLSSIENAILTGGASNKTIDCSAFTGDTTLNGGGGTDNLIGGSGNNIFVNNQGGSTTIVGGSNTNTINLTPAAFVSLVDGGGLDTISFSTTKTGITLDLTQSSGTGQNVDGSGFMVALNGTMENVVGTSFSDGIIGNAADNQIYGGLGVDNIEGGVGNDILFGGTGAGTADLDTSNDIIFGGPGRDEIDAGGGNDIIYGGTGAGTADLDTSDDIIFGGPGRDEIDAGAGNDIIYGGTGAGTADLDTSDDIIFGGPGRDHIDAGGGNDIIYGGTGAGTADLDTGDDIIFGGPGRDHIDAGGGNDIIYGGTGAGTADLDTGDDIIFGGPGRDHIDAGGGNDIIYGGTGAGTADLDTSDDIIFGGLGRDEIDAGVGNDIIFGGTGSPDTDAAVGDDIIIGGDGNDILGGGGGDDSLIGGLGNDTYVFIGAHVGSDTITEDPNLDADTLDFSGFAGAVNVDLAVTTSQVVNPDNLSLTFSSDTAIENVVGSKYADAILGNSRDNQFFGADQLDDRFASPPPWNGVKQVVYLDFDSNHSLLVEQDHVYSQAERDAIQVRLQADYASFHFQVTQTLPGSGPFATLFFNKTPIVNGQPQPGGLADDLDFRNLNLGGTAAIDVNLFLGGLNQPAATSANFVAISATVSGHELGHLLGLKHLDSAGPIGLGIPATVPDTDFLPVYPGPAQAFETNLHLMASPASVGSTLFDAVGDPFFGEREAVKLAFNDSGTAVNEQAGAHDSRATAQALALSSLGVPNTVVSGFNYGRDFAFAAIDVIGSIGLTNAGISEDDYYSFTGRAGDLINIQIMSNALTRITNPIDSILRVYDAAGNLVDYYNSAGVNDDELEGQDSILLDLILPSDGTFYVQVDTFTDANVPDSDTGDYELFIYRFDAGNATDGGDYLVGRGGNDSLIGGLGDDTLVGGAGDNTLDGGAGTDKVIESGDVNFALTDTSLTGPGTATLTSIEQAQLTGGGGANSFQINGWTGSAALDGGVGTDTLVGANTASSWNLTGAGAGNINGSVSFVGIENLTGGTASDTLAGLNTDNSWNITATNAGNLGAFTFSGVENLTGGSSDDSYVFGNGVGVTGAINGGGGVNSLDYAAYVTGVAVNLTTGAAAGSAGGVSSIQHVFGGTGNDSLTGNAAANILVGNGGNDTLYGYDGRDILIGGNGADFLDGGNDDDILIGARTVYDSNRAALLAILLEWTRTDLDYISRLKHISGAVPGGLNGSFKLNSTTVFDDNNTPDTLWGRGGLDWFITGTKDKVMDRGAGETNTKV